MPQETTSENSTMFNVVNIFTRASQSPQVTADSARAFGRDLAQALAEHLDQKRPAQRLGQ